MKLVHMVPLPAAISIAAALTPLCVAPVAAQGTPPDTTPPRLTAATVDGEALKLFFNESLSSKFAWVLREHFTVKKTPLGGSEQNVAQRGSWVFVAGGRTVLLWLANAVRSTDTDVKVSYTRPTSAYRDRLRDEAGNEVASFTDAPVTSVGRAPRVERAEGGGTALTITFDEPLAPYRRPPNGAFTVKKTPLGGGEETVSLSTWYPYIRGRTVTLRLANPVQATDTDVKVSYARPTTGDPYYRLVDGTGNDVENFTDQAVSIDAVRPALDRGEVDGGTVTLFFSEPLDPDSVGGRFQVNLRHPDGDNYNFAAKGEVAISGNAVKVGLGSPFGKKAGELGWPMRAEPGYKFNVASYKRPTDPAVRGLRDLDGNEVRTPYDGNRRTKYVYLDNLTGVAPSVAGVAVTSDAGGDAAYGLGEKIRVRLTFSKAVNVTGTPRMKIDFSPAAGDEKWAVYEKGGGARALDFVYTVAQGDASTAGVAVLANTLELDGGAIRSVSNAGENAALAHAGLGHDAAHKVDTTPPAMSAAIVNKTSLTLAFSEPLGTAPSLPNGAFTVKRTPQGGGEETVGLRGSPTVGRRTVTLTLANSMRGTDTDVKVSYRKLALDAGDKLRDEAGNEAADFVDRPVRNRVEAPSVTGAAVTSDAGDDAIYALGEKIRVTVTFSEAVAVDTANGTPRLKLDLGGDDDTGGRWAAYEDGSGTETLTFAWQAAAPDESSAGVAVPADILELNGGTIKSVATQADAALGHAGLGHDPAHKVDAAPPELLRGEVDGGTVTLHFSEALDPGSTGGRFMVDILTGGPLMAAFHASGPVSVAGTR